MICSHQCALVRKLLSCLQQDGVIRVLNSSVVVAEQHLQPFEPFQRFSKKDHSYVNQCKLFFVFLPLPILIAAYKLHFSYFCFYFTDWKCQLFINKLFQKILLGSVDTASNFFLSLKNFVIIQWGLQHNIQGFLTRSWSLLAYFSIDLAYRILPFLFPP